MTTTQVVASPKSSGLRSLGSESALTQLEALKGGVPYWLLVGEYGSLLHRDYIEVI